MDAAAFARESEVGWNGHVLAHYRDDVAFRSRKAVPLTGTAEIVGRPALASYWSAAVERQPDLAFTVEDVSAGHRVVTLLYRNHGGVRATETLWFDAEGRVTRAAACHSPDGA